MQSEVVTNLSVPLVPHCFFQLSNRKMRLFFVVVYLVF